MAKMSQLLPKRSQAEFSGFENLKKNHECHKNRDGRGN